MSCLSLSELPASDLAQLPDVIDIRKRDPFLIRTAIATTCRSLGLSEDDQRKCEIAGMREYWGRSFVPSNAHCVSIGIAMAHRLKPASYRYLRGFEAWQAKPYAPPEEPKA